MISLPKQIGRYVIAESNGRGGKAGTGRNKTATLQVREPNGTGFFLLKQFRYSVDDVGGKLAAYHKAIEFITTEKAGE